jgi:hypothetical protein
MAKRKPSDESADYEVGYCKPPKHTQFRPGQSGYPQGRRKGVRNLATDVKRTLSAQIKVKEGGRTKSRSTQEAALMVLREKALRGDHRGLAFLLELAMRFNSATEETPAPALSADDKAILDDFVAEKLAAAASENAVPTPRAKQRGRASLRRKLKRIAKSGAIIRRRLKI